ncbi:expressed unknown protein [Seminavis robusta]|uniref:Transmembrane protein n=1 Tax=Seminavis robusta TaxID=568900 RepID=A0A9N8EV45_9STRA|nr:expressed unknown protein [Seminavis robusta]|eukprot:Sro1851_g301660.1 n/a (318) ;mRNA; f:13869-14822
MRTKSGTGISELSDEAAEMEAEFARRQGTELIEHHLSHHMSQNPESSYVTWIATLHPENAQVAIDHRFFVPGNPWWTVYEEAKNDIPIATAVAAEANETADLEEQAPPPPSSRPDATPTGGEVKRKSCSEISPMAATVGFSMFLMASMSVLFLEACAICVYFFSLSFFRLANLMDPPNLWTGLLYSTCVFFYWSCALMDSSLLLSSVLTTEFVAASSYMFCAILGGCDMAAGWHQYTRRTCHLIRWAFRSKFEYPPRRFCGLMPVKEADDEKPPRASIQPAPSFSSTTNPTPSAPDDVFVVDEKDIVVDKQFVADEC